MRPNFTARPACSISIFSFRLVTVCLRFRFRVARLAPRWCLLAPPVRGVLRLVGDTRNPFFREKCIFCDKPDFSHVLGGLRQFTVANAGSLRNILRQNANGAHKILGYPQGLPQDSLRLGRIFDEIST